MLIQDPSLSRTIRIRGASEHNLKNVSLEIPRDALTVFTGVSGSGKSSLAFDTIYKEGQRRFLESLSAYARQFLGGFEKPKVESIDGLSPTLSIDQKTAGRSARSTVGTITEIHDHLRLLYARLGEPHCPGCGKRVAAQSAEEICARVYHDFTGNQILVCAPVVRQRKGEFRQLLEDLRRDGYTRLRIDGEVVRIDPPPVLKRHQRHTIEVVLDRLEVLPEWRSRLVEALEKCLALADGVVTVVDGAAEETFSSKFSCPACGVDLPELEPRLFSFNSEHGACPGCEGLGEKEAVDPDLVVVYPSLPFREGSLAGMLQGGQFFEETVDTEAFVALGKRLGFSLRSSWGDLSAEARVKVLHGDGEFEGLVPALTRIAESSPWVGEYMTRQPCADCGGSRLRPEARSVRFREKTLPELSAMPVGDLRAWFSGLRLEGGAALVGVPIVKNVLSRLGFLERVGLSYLTLSRRSDTLAGGEAQRLRLATQVGAGLQGVLFVLDEPSIGLHPRDNQALLGTLEELRDQGNTVLVVEHDRATMERADHIVDVGPGAGPLGGEIVAEGTARDIAASPRSVTGQYLAGVRSIPLPPRRRPPGKEWLELHDVRHNNLKGIDFRLPLGILVVMTGVSGSGKSSLVKHVLEPAMRKKLGWAHAQPGKHRSIRGYQHLDKVVVIDQSPIGRTPRSNPATYVKAFDLIRDLFAEVPEARARGYPSGRFSFNRDGGRCLECGGAGVTLVEMQFLPSVEVPCDACDGKRYNRETLEVRYRTKNIHDVLEMSIAEAAELFQDHPKIHRPLATLAGVGLGYMKLGQPSTTLSGGEAQRVKLAAELRRRDTGRTLYLFDEPTTGLHFEDVKALLGAMDELVSRGNSVLVIEHSTEVMKVADYIIDLGPEAGDGGGTIVAQGTPEEVAAVRGSHTGAALAEVLGDGERASPSPLGRGQVRRVPAGTASGERRRDIEVVGARQHNLKALDVRIPADSLTVITGVSGSGKTSLAFDTVFAEGQRRYLESLSTYARRFLGRMQRAEVDSITGLCPAIAIDQKSASSNPRSTVATITEVHDYLRLLYARIGLPHCPECGVPLEWTTPTRLAAELSQREAGRKGMILAPLEIGATVARAELLARLESLRSGLLKSGYTRILSAGEELRLDEASDAVVRRMLAVLSSEPAAGKRNGLYLVVDRVIFGEGSQSRLAASLEQAFERGAGVARVQLEGGEPILHTRAPACPQGHFTFPGEITPAMFSYSSHQGACPRCKGLGTEKRVDIELLLTRREKPILEALDPVLLRALQAFRPSVHAVLLGLLRHLGVEPLTRFQDLGEAARDVIFHGTPRRTVPLELKDGSTIQAAWQGLLPVVDQWAAEPGGGYSGILERFLREQTCAECGGGRLRRESLAVRIGGKGIRDLVGLTVREAMEFTAALTLDARSRLIAAQVLLEIQNRLRFLDGVGLGYLTLNRTANTLSGGEAQRIRLASQLGNRLARVLYVLDEPTVGLHQRDTRRLIAALEELKGLGNTVLLVEHDREVMEAADWIIDIGPGAGKRGGEVVALGTAADIALHPTSLTGRYLRREGQEEVPTRRRNAAGWIELEGATLHNLRGIRAAFPLGVFTAVSGVSGSGKSTLVLDVLAEVVRARLADLPHAAGLVASASGVESLRRLVVVDQKPIGRSPRSCPATFAGLWDLVRELYAVLPASRVRGYGPERFSFNTGSGRCMACEGQGATLVEMHFLSDVWVPCERCRGKRFDAETLGILFKGKNVGEILDLEVDAARELFDHQPRMLRILDALAAVGLGYIRLGQTATTLSGGEAQRLKLAAELIGREPGTLYILDEPTTGLHFDDVRKLLEVLQKLVDAGNTVVVIEHHLDVLRAADWVIDLGPEAGDEGGRITAEGPPERIADAPLSHTGRCLRASGLCVERPT